MSDKLIKRDNGLNWPEPHNAVGYAIVEVLWVDSGSSHGWRSREEEVDSPARRSTMRVRSVGYLVDETEHRLMLAESLSDNDNVGCTSTIPIFAIVQRTILREPLKKE